MRFIYQLIVLFLAAHFLWYLVREKKIWAQASAVMVLTLFLLRLFGIK